MTDQQRDALAREGEFVRGFFGPSHIYIDDGPVPYPRPGTKLHVGRAAPSPPTVDFLIAPVAEFQSWSDYGKSAPLASMVEYRRVVDQLYGPGERAEVETPEGGTAIRRTWKAGDSIPTPTFTSSLILGREVYAIVRRAHFEGLRFRGPHYIGKRRFRFKRTRQGVKLAPW